MSDKNTKDEIQISADGKGLTLKGKGEFVSRWGNGLADLFKRFGQYYGEKGDAIEHERNMRNMVRVFDEDVLKMTLVNALEKMQRREIPIQPASPKFLVQWSEAASIEDVSDTGGLSDIWAELLVSSVAKRQENHLFYIDLLRKMDAAHISFLLKLISSNSDQKRSKWQSKNGKVVSGLNRALVHAFQTPFNEETDKYSSPESQTALVNAALSEVYDDFDVGRFFSSIYHRRITKIEDGIEHYETSATRVTGNKISYDDIAIAQSLAASNLIEFHKSKTIELLDDKLSVSVEYVTLTDFGASFLIACGKR